MAIVQLRHHTAGRVCYDDKRLADKTSMEAIRALKRRLSNVIYVRMLADLGMMGGPVAQWFEQRESLAQLVELARTPNLTSPDRSNPDPARLRDVVMLALSQGHAEQAVSLMEWYLQRDRFHKFDSLERASAFDAERSVRFAEYANLRRVGGSLS